MQFPIILTNGSMAKIASCGESAEIEFTRNAPIQLVERTCARLKHLYRNTRTVKVIRDTQRTIIIQKVYPRSFSHAQREAMASVQAVRGYTLG